MSNSKDDSLISEDSLDRSERERLNDDERRSMQQLFLDEEAEERTAENLYDEDLLEE